jgi:hypothetical protein
MDNGVLQALRAGKYDLIGHIDRQDRVVRPHRRLRRAKMELLDYVDSGLIC